MQARRQRPGLRIDVVVLLVFGCSLAAWLAARHVSLQQQRANLLLAAARPVPQRLIEAAGHVPVGRHITLDFYNVPKPLSVALEDTNSLQRKVSALIKQAKMTLLGHSCHVFEVQGTTCVWLLSESHLSLHTWPEHGYAALDIFTCGTKARPELLAEGMKQMLQPGLVVREEQKRGGLNPDDLSPEQAQAKELVTFREYPDESDGLQEVFHRVPIVHTSRSAYQHIQVVDVHGQLGRCLLLQGIVQFCSHDLDGYTNHMSHEPLKTLLQLQQEQPCPGSTTVPALVSDAAGRQITQHQQQQEKGKQGMTTLVPHPPFHPAGASAKPFTITCQATQLSRQFPALSCTGKPSQHKPARVLLIGGGDGWVAGHLIGCYGSLVHSVQAVELDKAVSDVTSAFFFNATGLDPFNQPRISWKYTDASQWVKDRVHRCSDRGSTNRAQSAVRHLTDSLDSPSASVKKECEPYDIVIIDSTDHTETASGTLYTEAFYASLYRLMAPRASLIQQFNTYDRVFNKALKETVASIKRGGWEDVFNSLVYTPAYSGETVFLQAAKRAE